MGSCGGGDCASHCRRGDDDLASSSKEENHERIGVTTGSCHVEFDSLSAPRCIKCGAAESKEGNGSGLCAACLRTQVFNKFKLAVTNNALISPNDNLLVAFSGGPASRVVLQFIHEMQCKALKSWDASKKSQALPVFGVGVTTIDESSACYSPCSLPQIQEALEEIRCTVSTLSPPHKEFHLLPLESIYSTDYDDGRFRLKEMLSKISDATGKEDMLQYLRMLVLFKVASKNGYNKIILGSCTSGIARHIIASTVKGRGFSLPADLQYIDARREIPVVLPLRDCLAQELSMLCDVEALRTYSLFGVASGSINALVSSFVSHLQDENASREHTIVRTAAKLRPFCFSKFLNSCYYDYSPSRTRHKFRNGEHIGSPVSEVLCPICGSPLSESEHRSLTEVSENPVLGAHSFMLQCCQSCRFQILPSDDDSYENFYSLMPQSMTQRLRDTGKSEITSLREQIKDCLLSEDEGD